MPITFTYFAPRDPLPPQRLDDRKYAACHAKQTTPTEVLTVDSLRDLRLWVRAQTVDGRKGDAGYIVAGKCAGQRKGDCVGPAAFALIDYDGAAPDWDALNAYEGFAWTTASHVDSTHEAWRVVIPFTELVEHGRLTSPFDGAHIRNRSQPAFLPTQRPGGPAVQWVRLTGTARLDAEKLGAAPLRKRPRAEEPRRSSSPSVRREGAFPFDSPPDLGALAKYVPPAGVDGDRHVLVRAIGGWLARRGYDPEAIAKAVRFQIPSSDPVERAAQAQDAAERVRRGEDAPGWEALSAWAERYGKGASTLARLERACKDPREPEGFGSVGEPWSEWWAGVVPAWEARAAARPAHAGAEVDATGAHLHPVSGWPWILQFGEAHWLHSLDSASYQDRQYRSSELRPAVAGELAGLISEDDRKPAQLEDSWIRVVRTLESTYVARAHTYDPATRTLTLAALRWMPAERARRHAHIDRWLRALFGPGYDAAEQWLASLVALDRPAPCLYLPGPKELGKSLLADGLARIWGRPAPVGMREAIDSFNEATASCPLVFTDEGFPPDLDFSAFREMVTQHTRRVNEKYRAKYSVDGCGRYMLAANNEDVLRYQRTGVLTQADLEAIADRLLVVPCCEEARDVLREHDHGTLARWAQSEIAEHVLWLASTVALEPLGRMAAKPGGGERILAGVVASRNADVLSRIREMIGTGDMGLASGVYVPKGAEASRREVWVSVPALAATFEGRMASAQVRDCCDAFALRTGSEQHKIGKRNFKFRVLSRLRLDEAFAKID